MREHQIAISLKPQQFELLQRLARERGFKSVTAYVKQKIVELALGLESDSPAAGAGGTLYAGSGSGLSAEQQTLLVDLTRIHSELRAFVGHSIEDEIAAGVSAATTDLATAFELPPPGQIMTGRYDNEAAGGMTPYENAAANSSDTSYSGASSASPSTSSTTAGEPVSSQVLPTNNLGGFGFRLGGFTGGAALSRFQAPVDNADRLTGYREIMDDLEELADRAFAISPRLGALDEEAPAEPATGRGARPANESIFVEPILPGNAGAAQRGKAAPQSQPISMVAPMSAADLPGPAEMEATASQARAPVPMPLPTVSAPAANPTVQPPVTPTVAGNTTPAAAPLATPPATHSGLHPAALAATPAPPQPGSTASATPDPVQPPPGSAAAPVAEAPVAEVANPPLPGDDLLSELLDESLIAHAQAPKLAGDNSPALEHSEKIGTEDSAIPTSSSGAPPFVEALDSLEEERQEAVEQSVEQPVLEPVQEPVQETAKSMPQSDPSVGSGAAPYNDTDEEGERQSQSGNVGPGPPPKRRRT